MNKTKYFVMEGRSKDAIPKIMTGERDLVERAEGFCRIDIKPESELEVKCEDQEDLCVENWKSIHWNCCLCQQILPTFESFKQHVESFHQVRSLADTTYDCIDCTDSLFGYASFINHLRTVHYENLKLCCDVCNKTFIDFEQLSIHRDKHIDVSTNIHPSIYYCSLCGEVDSTEKNHKYHIQLFHSLTSSENAITDPLTVCKDEPLETFTTTDNTESHQLFVNTYQLNYEVDESNEIYRCGQCSKGFLNEDELWIHIKTHKEKSIHQCKLCLKVFPIRSYLKRHVCRATRLGNENSINTRLNNPKEENVFKCEMCVGTFKTAANLKSHMIFIHSKNSPSLRKIRARGLKTTVQEIRDNKYVRCYYKCKNCNKEYITFGGFKRHSEFCQTNQRNTSSKKIEGTKKNSRKYNKKKQSKICQTRENLEDALFFVEIDSCYLNQ